MLLKLISDLYNWAIVMTVAAIVLFNFAAYHLWCYLDYRKQHIRYPMKYSHRMRYEKKEILIFSTVCAFCVLAAVILYLFA